MEMEARGKKPAGPPVVPMRPMVGFSGWWRVPSLSSPPDANLPVIATAAASPLQPSRARPARGGQVWYGRGKGGVRRSATTFRMGRSAAGEPIPPAGGTARRGWRHGLPQIPAALLRAGHRHPDSRAGRPIVSPARQRVFGYRANPNGKERDFSLLSALIALFLGLLLVTAGLYGIFLGMSQQEAVPALAPVGRDGDETVGVTGVKTPSPTWKDHLRGLVGPGLRLAARELWTSALATALPGLLRVGPDRETLPDEEQGQQIQSPPGDRGIWGWLAALTGIDVGSPESVLSYTLPGLRTAGGGPASLPASQLPARGGNSAAAAVGDSATIGAGGEWPGPEVLPSLFIAAPSASLATPEQRGTGFPNSGGNAGGARESEASRGTGAAAATGNDQPRSATGREAGPSGDDSREPLVLIYHTHTAEAYHAPGRRAEKDHYEWNSTNSGVIQVGKEITATLRAAGIPAVHSVKVNDYPEFRRSYSNSRQLVREYLQKYPSIVVALDIHRDGKEYTPDTVGSDGQRIARVAFVVGTNTAALANPHWGKNLAFAQELHQALQKLHPGVSRGIMLREDARFNEDLLPNLLVVEVGTYTNELAEAKAAGRLLGRALAEILNRP